MTIAAFVIKDDKILLGQRAAHLAQGGKWGPLGGFLERNETMAEGVEREVMEESGYRVRVDELFYVSDDPNRAAEDRQNLSFVYLAEALEKIAEHDSETAALQWVPIEALPPDDQIAFDFAIPLRLLQDYRRQQFPLPYFWKR
jgi:ADP-ribose pyrophosphatase YjhB (NUDIX family)